MTNTEILSEAKKKAEKNGYKYPDYLNADEVVFYLDKNLRGIDGFYGLIFDQDFAKAFWGEQKIITIEGDEYKLNNIGFNVKTNYPNLIIWEYHLQQMVLEKEPLKYLEKFL